MSRDHLALACYATAGLCAGVFMAAAFGWPAALLPAAALLVAAGRDLQS